MFSTFHAHHHDDSPHCGHRGRHHARFGERDPFGRGFGRHDRFERGFGGRERMFDSGDLQLIILNLLALKPSYGYELIKAIEERMAGGYTPSPGVVYPTLTLLEERGLTRVEPTEGSRKVYAITEAGLAELGAQADRLRELNERVAEDGKRFDRGRSPRIRRSMKELQRSVLLCALRGRESGKGLSTEQVTKIAEAIEAAARTIDAL
jgi:DNA-binding PadR family transcriptional regulator